MIILIYIACFVIFMYAALIFFLISGLVRAQPKRIFKASMHFSIVVPFRNEVAVLPETVANFTQILNLYPEIEVIFVNDHSTDLSHNQLNSMLEETGIALLHLPENKRGKKHALQQGAEIARGEWILTVDADTRLNPDSIATLMSQNFDGISCVVVPVMPSPSQRVVSKLFDLEFMALQAVGVASARHHLPLLANGASLLVRRDSYLKAAAQRTDWHLPGGDDIFAMFSIAKLDGNNSITTFVPPSPLAETKFPTTLAALIRQRIRWIGKTPNVSNFWYSLVAWLVLLANMGFVVIWALAFFKENWILALIFTAIKWLPEIALMTWGVLYFRRRDTWPWIFVGLVIYPFYLLALVTATAFIKPTWKE